MKTKFKLILAAISVIFLAACEDDTKNLYDGPSLVHFTESSGRIFVADTDDGETNTKIVKLGVTLAENADRTVELELGGTAEAGVHYTLESNQVVIPANEFVAEVPVYFHFEEFGDEELTVEISIAGGNVEPASFNNTFIIRAERYCETLPEMFVGTYEVREVSEFNGEYDPYTITISYDPAMGDTLVVHNLWEFVPDVKVVVREPSFANFVFEIPPQYYFTHDEHGDATIQHLSPGSFNPCSFEIETSYEIFVPAGYFDIVLSSVWTRIDDE
jgi:hypothetical protein